MEENEFQFIPKPSSVSWNDLIQLWRTSYEERKAEGLLYGASVQDDETLIKRASAGTCFCAFIGDELAGTIVASEKGNGGGVCLCLISVIPQMKKRGIGGKMMRSYFEIAKTQGVSEITLYTSEKAKTLVSWYKRLGFSVIGVEQFSGTNSYDLRFRKAVFGRKYSAAEVWLRYRVSSFLCRIRKTEHGDFRFFGKVERLLRRAAKLILRK